MNRRGKNPASESGPLLHQPRGAPPPLSRLDPLSSPTALRLRVDEALAEVFDEQISTLRFLESDRQLVAETLRAFVLGSGKRLRPLFVYWGYRGAGQPDDERADAVIRASCAMELLHACALIHDDVMDDSAQRRGRSSIHVGFAQMHRERQWQGDADRFGASVAILFGDLALTWADAALSGAGLDDKQLVSALAVFNTLRSELMGGQFLDLLSGNRGDADERAARRVLTYKSAKYTVERPLHLGAALGLGPPRLKESYSAYGLPLGEAFQLRDDLLGMFGTPAATGKPAGDDLREGKRTYLVVRARARSTGTGRRLLDAALGNAKLSEDDVLAVRDVVRHSGAVEDVEARIAILAERARGAIDDDHAVAPEVRMRLVELVDELVTRTA